MFSLDVDPLSRDIKRENYKSNSSEGERSPTKKSRRQSDTGDARRQKYRQRQKNERDGLREIVDELSTQVRELINAREGKNTTARTDLVLSKSFWRQVATQQREQRRRAEAERKRLSAIVNSQSAYIENLGVALRERPSVFPAAVVLVDGGGYDKIDDWKWLRLKSSDAALYEAYLQEVNDSYARVDKVFDECSMDALLVGTVSSLHLHNPNGEVEYSQYVNKLLQPFSFEDTCNNMWEVSKLPHRHIDREVYKDVSDSGNTIAFKFRLKNTLTTGSTVSILKRVLTRQFHDNGRVVIVWRIFSESEGIFSGMDIDETAWVSIRPFSHGSKSGTLMEACSRQVPVQYITANANDSAVKAFRAMLQDALGEDEREIIHWLGKPFGER